MHPRLEGLSVGIVLLSGSQSMIQGTLQICRCAWGVGRNKAVSYINNAKTSFALFTVLTFVSMMQDQWQALLEGSGLELWRILHCPDCLKGREKFHLNVLYVLKMN